MLRKLAALAVCVLAVLAFPADAAKPDANVPVTIMTQNMDDGTDLTYVIAALTGRSARPLGEAVDLTYLELQASDFEKRAGFIATDIADKTPEVIALQEAVLWRVGPTPESATNVLFDQLDLLLSALREPASPTTSLPVHQCSTWLCRETGSAARSVSPTGTPFSSVPTFKRPAVHL